MKITILFLLIITSLYSDAKVYLGVNYGYFNETFKNNIPAESSNTITKLKAGYGDREEYSIELSIEKMDNSASIFSNNDSAKQGLNVDLVKAFDFGIYVNPFLKAGFGTGYLEIDRQTQSTLHYGSFNLGAGLLLPVNENFDFEIGYSYKNMTYEGVDTIIDHISYSSDLNAAYFGFNIRL